MEQLTPRAAEIMDLTIQGLKSGQIAERLGLTGAYVSTIMSAANFQHTLAIRREKLENRIDDKVANATIEAGTIIKKHSVAAAQRLVDLVDSTNDPLALRAAESVLDRGGIPKKVDGGIKMAQQIVIVDDKTAKVIQETLEMEKNDATV